MYIQSFVRPNSRILVVMDYPSVKDVNGCFLEESNSIRFLSEQMRQIGIDPLECSFYQVMDEAFRGESLSDLFFATTRADKAHSVERQGLYIKDSVVPALHAFEAFLESVNPKVVLCMSVLALGWIAGGASLDAWRGSMLSYRGWNFVVSQDLNSLYKRDELSMSWHTDLQRVKSALSERRSFDELLEEFEVTTNPTYRQASDFLEEILAEMDLPHGDAIRVAFDVETRNETISFFGFATSERRALVVPLIDVEGKSYWSVAEEFELVKLARQVLTHKKARVAMQNGQYDVQYVIKNYGFQPRLDCDTMVEAHMLFTKGQKLSLAYLSSLFCSFYRYWKEDGKDFHKSFQTAADHEKYQMYNGFDCCYTFELAREVVRATQRSVHPFVRAMQRRLQTIVIKPVLRGLRFDSAKQKRMREEHLALKRSYETWLNYMIPDVSVTKFGNAAWWDSPTKMAHLFYNQLGLDPVIDRKTRRPTTADAALIELGKQEPILKPVLDVLRDYRSLSKTLDSYLAAQVTPSDGRMRTQYMLAGTDTFRLASKIDAFGYGLNFQNLTKG